MAKTCNWTGKSGTVYNYTIYEIGGDWNDVSGNYIFAKEPSPHNWEAVYIGETESFKDRLPNHEKLPCIKRNGGTHVHAHTNENEKARLAEESDLLSNHTTPCND
jgi:hypothetical protein